MINVCEKPGQTEWWWWWWWWQESTTPRKGRPREPRVSRCTRWPLGSQRLLNVFVQASLPKSSCGGWSVCDLSKETAHSVVESLFFLDYFHALPCITFPSCLELWSDCTQSHPRLVGIQAAMARSAWHAAQNNCLDWGLQSCVKFERKEQISSAAGPALKLWLRQIGPRVDCGSRAGPVNRITGWGKSGWTCPVQ